MAAADLVVMSPQMFSAATTATRPCRGAVGAADPAASPCVAATRPGPLRQASARRPGRRAAGRCGTSLSPGVGAAWTAYLQWLRLQKVHAAMTHSRATTGPAAHHPAEARARGAARGVRRLPQRAGPPRRAARGGREGGPDHRVQQPARARRTGRGRHGAHRGGRDAVPALREPTRTTTTSSAACAAEQSRSRARRWSAGPRRRPRRRASSTCATPSRSSGPARGVLAGRGSDRLSQRSARAASSPRACDPVLGRAQLRRRRHHLRALPHAVEQASRHRRPRRRRRTALRPRTGASSC